MNVATGSSMTPITYFNQASLYFGNQIGTGYFTNGGTKWSAQGGYQNFGVNNCCNGNACVRFGFIWNNENDVSRKYRFCLAITVIAFCNFCSTHLLVRFQRRVGRHWADRQLPQLQRGRCDWLLHDRQRRQYVVQCAAMGPAQLSFMRAFSVMIMFSFPFAYSGRKQLSLNFLMSTTCAGGGRGGGGSEIASIIG